MTNQPKTFICRGCGQPTTAHAEGCKMAPGAPRTVAPQASGQPSGQPPAGKRRISDRDPFVRAEYLPPQGEEKVIKAWNTIIVHDPNSHKNKTMPALIFTDDKTLPINVTNLRALVILFDDDEASSVGQPILLVPVVVSGKKSISVRRAAVGTPAARSGKISQQLADVDEMMAEARNDDNGKNAEPSEEPLIDAVDNLIRAIRAEV